MVNVGPSFLGGATAGAMLLAVNYALPEPAFIAVRELSVSNGYVTLDRAIRRPDVIADFQVVVVDEATGLAVCHGTGWAEFETDESRVKTFTLDDYVGDPGCWERLSGEYTMYTTWSPRDGRRPVQNTTDFNTDD